MPSLCCDMCAHVTCDFLVAHLQIYNTIYFVGIRQNHFFFIFTSYFRIYLSISFVLYLHFSTVVCLCDSLEVWRRMNANTHSYTYDTYHIVCWLLVSHFRSALNEAYAQVSRVGDSKFTTQLFLELVNLDKMVNRKYRKRMSVRFNITNAFEMVTFQYCRID